MVRIGVIGTNFITEKFIKHASLVEGFELNAVYSRTEEKAKSFADKFSITNIYTDLEAMAQSSDIDAAYIASPNSLHAQQSLLFLKNKKHVLCEKAVASNLEELKGVIAMAEENAVLFMEAMITTMLPNFNVIKENLHKLGKIRRYFANYCQYSSRYDAYRSGINVNTFDPVFSNGSIMDIGVYCIHPIVKLFGMPTKITSSSLLLPSGVDGQGSIILAYENMEGIIMYSKIANSYLPSEIQGEKGSMLISKINVPERVQIFYTDGSVEELTVPQKQESMFYEVREFIRLIENKQLQSPINSHNQSMMVMEILDEVRRQNGIVFPADTNLLHA